MKNIVKVMFAKVNLEFIDLNLSKRTHGQKIPKCTINGSSAPETYTA